MKMTYTPGIFLIVLSCASNTFGDVGPCNEDYKFVCDDEGHCTCVKKAPKKLRVVILDEPFFLVRGAGETLEVVPGFDPGTKSACEIVYTLQIRSLTGDVVDAQRNHTLKPRTPFDIYEHDSRPMAGSREWLKLDLTAEGTDCSVEEVQSFRTHVATYHGSSGQSVYQATIRHRFTFPDLTSQQVPDIVPADSTLRCAPVD
jgi:hypothetical protein